MSYKVQFLHRNTTLWQNASSGHGSEQQAIFHGKEVAKRSNVDKVRVVNASGSVCWMS